MACRSPSTGSSANGLLLKGAYTWSRAINWTDDDGWTGAPTFNWGPAQQRNRAVAGYNRTHMFTMGFVYEMPFGKGRVYARNGFPSKLLGGWQTNGTFVAYTGTPLTVTASGTDLNAPGNGQTADQVKPEVAILGEIGANSPGSIRWLSRSRPASGSAHQRAGTHWSGPDCGISISVFSGHSRSPKRSRPSSKPKPSI